MENGKRTLGSSGILQWMQCSETFQRCDMVVQLRVVLHGTGSQGIRAVVDAIGDLGQMGKMPDHTQLRQLGQLGRRHPLQVRWQWVAGWDIGGRIRISASAFL